MSDFRARLAERVEAGRALHLRPGTALEWVANEAARIHEEETKALREDRRQWEEAAATEAAERRRSHARGAALRERVAKLEAANRALEDALDRAVGNMTLAVRGLPVRDMAETVGECGRAKDLAAEAIKAEGA